jgi:HK97 family phage prohead protease
MMHEIESAIEVDVELEAPEVDELGERYSKRQAAQYAATEHTVEIFGKYDQGTGAEGAHYAPESPYLAEGLACSNCAFYDGARACEVVSGDIAPEGICKLWIIPNDLITTPLPVVPRARLLDVEAREINGREREVRVIGTGLEVEERAAGTPDSEPVRFSGYAAVFNSPSERLWDRSRGEFTELIQPGAFHRTLGLNNDVRMYVNHNSDQVLASTRSMTLNLSEDSRGLRVEAELPNTTYANDLAELMRSGVVDSMSFGFTVPEGGDTWQGDTRTLSEIALHEVSVVTGHPAYPETAGASVRAVEAEPTPMPVKESVVPLQINQRYAELYSRLRD